MSVFFHIDLDAFFASVEVVDNPALAGKPVIVGAERGHRGVVSTCSYAARAFGVYSAMPISEAARLCPEAAFLPVRMERYAEMSARVMGAFSEFTPDVTRVSIDEASLDMAGTERLWGPAPDAAAAVKRRVRELTGLTISIGVSANRYVAKIASGVRKPDGLVMVEPGGEADFMMGLRLKDLWGAGEKTRERLAELGITTIPQLRSVSEANLAATFGPAGGDFLYKACRGVDPGIYAGEAKSRSMSTETTFERDLRDAAVLESTLLGMSEELTARMLAESASPSCAFLKLRYDDFSTLTARATYPEPFRGAIAIYEAGRELFRKKWDGRPVRLIGLGLSGFGSGAGVQGSLFGDEDEKAARVERAAFDAARRGLGKLTRASLIRRKPS